MKIYAAGYYSASGVRTVNGLASNLSRPDHVLESYFYIGKNHEAQKIRDDKRTIFLDSGAFSMFTQGVEVDLSKYAQFIIDNRDIIHIASNLDVIGKDAEQGTYDNQQALERLLENHELDVKPVHHARDKDTWLRRYMDEGYEDIFLGGMVPESTPYLRGWLDHVFSEIICDGAGLPRVRIHGFGLTTLELMLRYPWFSVDSTAWVMNSRYGICFMDIDGRTFKVHFSDQSPTRHDDGGWHYKTLKPAEKKKVDERLEVAEIARRASPAYDAETEEELEEKTGFKQGYNAEALSKMYGWRDHWNINYFNRVQSRGIEKFVREQKGLFS